MRTLCVCRASHVADRVAHKMLQWCVRPPFRRRGEGSECIPACVTPSRYSTVGRSPPATASCSTVRESSACCRCSDAPALHHAVRATGQRARRPGHSTHTCGRNEPTPRGRGRGEPTPGADVGGVSPLRAEHRARPPLPICSGCGLRCAAQRQQRGYSPHGTSCAGGQCPLPPRAVSAAIIEPIPRCIQGRGTVLRVLLGARSGCGAAHGAAAEGARSP